LESLYPSALIHIVSNHVEASECFFCSLRTVPDLSRYDYFVIASQTASHYEHFHFIDERVANKRILIEKPVFSEYHEGHSRGNEVYVGYNLRYHDVLWELRALLRASGQVLSANIVTGQYLPSWRPETDYRKSYSASKELGGGVLLDLSHEIDYIQWIFGKFEKVSAIDAKVSSLDITSDDMAYCIGKTEKGIYINLSLDYLSRVPTRRISVQTDTETIIADMIESTIAVYNNNAEVKNITLKKNERDYTYQEMHKDVLNHDKNDFATFEDGLSVMRTIEAIKRNFME